MLRAATAAALRPAVTNDTGPPIDARRPSISEMKIEMRAQPPPPAARRRVVVWAPTMRVHQRLRLLRPTPPSQRAEAAGRIVWSAVPRDRPTHAPVDLGRRPKPSARAKLSRKPSAAEPPRAVGHRVMTSPSTPVPITASARDGGSELGGHVGEERAPSPARARRAPRSARAASAAPGPAVRRHRLRVLRERETLEQRRHRRRRPRRRRGRCRGAGGAGADAGAGAGRAARRCGRGRAGRGLRRRGRRAAVGPWSASPQTSGAWGRRGRRLREPTS